MFQTAFIKKSLDCTSRTSEPGQEVHPLTAKRIWPFIFLFVEITWLMHQPLDDFYRVSIYPWLCSIII